jgi:hypothetical protein
MIIFSTSFIVHVLFNFLTGATESKEVATKMHKLLQPGIIVEGIVVRHPDSSLLLLIPSLLKELVLSGLLSHSDLGSIEKMFSFPEARAATDIVRSLKKEKPKNLLTLCDVNQNIISSFDIPMSVLQGLDNTLAEIVQNVLQEELLAKAAEEVRQYEAGLKLTYFRTLQNWVRSCEDKILVSFSPEIEEKKAENFQVTGIYF